MMRGQFAAVVLVLVGALALARNLGVFDFDFGEVSRVRWPLIPLCAGLILFFSPPTHGCPVPRPKVLSRARTSHDESWAMPPPVGGPPRGDSTP